MYTTLKKYIKNYCLGFVVIWTTVTLIQTYFLANSDQVATDRKSFGLLHPNDRNSQLTHHQDISQILSVETVSFMSTAERSHYKVKRQSVFHDDYSKMCKNNRKNISSYLYSYQQGWEKLTRSLENYSTFHSTEVARLKACVDHSIEDFSNCRNIKTLTWFCRDFRACSGLGDQLYQIQFSLVLAVIFNRVLFISWDSKSMKTMQHLQPSKINWKSLTRLDTYNSIEVSGRLETSELADVLNSSLQHLTISSSLPVPFYRAFAKARKVSALDIALHKLGLTEILRTENDRDKLPFVLGELLNYLFKFTADVLSGTDKMQASLGLNSSYVAVHIRTGFIGTEYEETGRFNFYKIQKDQRLWNKSISCSLKLADKELGTDSSLYLATDSQLVKTWAHERYGGRIKVNDFTPYHVALEHITSMTDYESIGVWIDFMIMARATYLVHGISSFSNNAGSLCSIPKHRQCTILECKCK